MIDVIRGLAIVAIVAALGTMGACCSWTKQEFEDVNPAVPGTHFVRIATVSGVMAPTAIRDMVKTREKLQQAGIDAEPFAGHWKSESSAVNSICFPPVGPPFDGVLIVSYLHMTLYDCATAQPAYDIQGSTKSGGMRMDEMTSRLIRYLNRNKDG